MCGVCISARNSASSPYLQFVKPCTSILKTDKQETDQLWIGFCRDGADAEARVPAIPVAGDDAAVDAGDQAAAAVQSRSRALRRGRARTEPAAGPCQRRSRGAGPRRADA